MKLKALEEPIGIKEIMKSTKARIDRPAIDWDSFVVWSGSQNQLQRFLWSGWKSELSPQGWTWQKFTKLLRHKTLSMVQWYRGPLPWEDLLEEITELIHGRYGQDLAKR